MYNNQSLINEWINSTLSALKDLWLGFILFIPKLIGALIVFLIGWIIAVIIGKIFAEVLKRLKFDRIFEKRVLREALEKAEIKISASNFVGVIIKWIIVIAFLSVAADLLGLTQFTLFVNSLLNYIPNVVIAALIFVVAVIVVDITEKIVRATVESAKIGYGGVIVAIVRWSIWIFAILAILYQLNIVQELLQTIVQGIMAFLAIAGGLAFGLGGKEAAGEIIRNIKNKIER